MLDYDTAQQTMADDEAGYQAQREHDEYCNRPIPVFCDICCARQTATQEQLEKQGWLLGPGYELCGFHD